MSKEQEIRDKIEKTKNNKAIPENLKKTMIAGFEKQLEKLSAFNPKLNNNEKIETDKINLPKQLPKEGDIVNLRGEELKVLKINKSGIELGSKDSGKPLLSMSLVSFFMETEWGYSRKVEGQKAIYFKPGEHNITTQEFIEINGYENLAAFSKAIFNSAKQNQKRVRKKRPEPKEKKKTSYKYKGKDLSEMSEEDCAAAIKESKERREKAAKAEKKSKSRPVMEKVTANVAQAVKKVIENIPAADIKDAPKTELKKIDRVITAAKTFVRELKSILGDDFDKDTIDDEFKEIHALAKELHKKYGE